MPYYDYLCDSCGPFTETRPMAEADAPQPCPDCAKMAPRAFLRAPAMAQMNAGKRRAYEANEKSRHAPVLASTLGRAHGPGCSCCRPAGKPGNTETMKGFPGKRPWMIAH